MIRVITLPNGRQTRLSTYVKAWQTLRAMPADTSVSGFDHFPESAGVILREIRRGMHDRINRHDAAYGRGRKWADDWQRETMQCAMAVNTPRLIVRWAPMHLRERLAHRLTGPDE